MPLNKETKPNQKQSKSDEQDMWDTARDKRTNLYMTFFYGPRQLDVPVSAN